MLRPAIISAGRSVPADKQAHSVLACFGCLWYNFVEGVNTVELKENNTYRIMLKAQEAAGKSVKAFKDRHLNDVPPELIQQVYTVSLVENAILEYNACVTAALKKRGIDIPDILEDLR